MCGLGLCGDALELQEDDDGEIGTKRPAEHDCPVVPPRELSISTMRLQGLQGKGSSHQNLSRLAHNRDHTRRIKTSEEMMVSRIAATTPPTSTDSVASLVAKLLENRAILSCASPCLSQRLKLEEELERAPRLFEPRYQRHRPNTSGAG